MILFQADELSVRLLEPVDAALLVKWLSDPRVLEYYEGRDRPHDMELVKHNFYEHYDEVTQCMIQYRNNPIGYIQFYIIDAEEVEKYDYADYSGRIFGMDQFIGETVYWNQGIGSSLIQAMVRYLGEHKGASKIVMDPQAWNARALRVYEKSGFRKKKFLANHEMHEGKLRDCWLMEFDFTTGNDKGEYRQDV